jgi:biopolymer transport protein TolR
MIMSRRASRMDRHHKRSGRMAGINLVSMMDIFTILVFFLLVNSSDGEVLPTLKSIELPESVAQEKPRENVVVMVTESEILVQGRVVATVEALRKQETEISTGLEAALNDLHHDTMHGTAIDAPDGREVTIMGDKAIPYALLKKIMTSCSRAGYGRISLAVIQREPAKG